MTVMTFQAPGANQDGFVAVKELQRRAGTMTREDFTDRYPVPALWVADVLPEGLEEGGRSTLDSRPQLLTVAHRGLEILRYFEQVAFVGKRPGNPFPTFVSLGRSPSNDVVIGAESITKVHGYFTFGEDGWGYTDRGSTNGSTVGGTPLEPSVRAPLRDGARLSLGTSLILEFLTPESLYGRLQTPS